MKVYTLDELLDSAIDDRTPLRRIVDSFGALMHGILIVACAQHFIPIPVDAEFAGVDLCGNPCNMHFVVHYERYS